MKKLVSVLLVMLVVASAFAVASVKVGGTFGFDVGNSKYYEADWYAMSYKQNGFGFSVAGDYELDEKLDVFADFTMLFCSNPFVLVEDADITEYTDILELLELEAKTKINFSVAAGVKYALDLGLPVDVKVGGGLYFERLIDKASATGVELNMKLYNLGVTALAEAEYAFAEDFGAVLTVMPRLGVYNGISIKSPAYDEKTSGFNVSFSMPISVGVAYNF